MCVLYKFFTLKLGQSLSLCKHDSPGSLTLTTPMDLNSLFCCGLFFSFLKNKKAILRKEPQTTFFAILSLHFFAFTCSKNSSFLMKALAIILPNINSLVSAFQPP